MADKYTIKLNQSYTCDQLLEMVKGLGLDMGEPYFASLVKWETAEKQGNFVIVFPAVSHRYQVQIFPQTGMFKMEKDEATGKIKFSKLALQIGNEYKARVSETLTANVGENVADSAARGAIRKALPVGGIAGGMIMGGIEKSQPDYKQSHADLDKLYGVLSKAGW